MNLLTIIILIAVVGLIMWLVNEYIPMDARIKKLLNIVVIVCVIIWLLKVIGAFAYLSKIQI